MDKDREHAPYAIVVDNNPVILLHVAEVLESAGFCTFAASDCHQALANLADHGDRIKLLFSNVQISGPMDGFDLARFAYDKWPEIAIVVSSGDRGALERTMPKGLVSLATPFSSADVLGAVCQALDVANKSLSKRLRLASMAA